MNERCQSCCDEAWTIWSLSTETSWSPDKWSAVCGIASPATVMMDATASQLNLYDQGPGAWMLCITGGRQSADRGPHHRPRPDCEEEDWRGVILGQYSATVLQREEPRWWKHQVSLLLGLSRVKVIVLEKSPIQNSPWAALIMWAENTEQSLDQRSSSQRMIGLKAAERFCWVLLSLDGKNFERSFYIPVYRDSPSRALPPPPPSVII